MTEWDKFFISLAVLILSTLGCAAFFYLGMAFFTYQGHGMDWIYWFGYLMIILWFVSLISTLGRWPPER